jgi:hypothetical protein
MLKVFSTRLAPASRSAGNFLRSFQRSLSEISDLALTGLCIARRMTEFPNGEQHTAKVMATRILDLKRQHGGNFDQKLQALRIIRHRSLGRGIDAKLLLGTTD